MGHSPVYVFRELSVETPPGRAATSTQWAKTTRSSTVHTPTAGASHGHFSGSQAPQDSCPFQLPERRPRRGEGSQPASQEGCQPGASFQRTQCTQHGKHDPVSAAEPGCPRNGQGQAALRSPVSSTVPGGVRGLPGWLKVQDRAGVSL